VQRTNCLLIDNVKPAAGRVVSSPSIERTITMERYSFRRIGTSELIEGDNYLQFIITWNGGALSSDLSSRSVYVKLAYEGDPSKRVLPAGRDLLDYAREYRNEIVAELLGMIERWQAKECPLVQVPCRFKQWAAMVNGILTANGITDFLSTYTEDKHHTDASLLMLAELAAAKPGSFTVPKSGSSSPVLMVCVTTK